MQILDIIAHATALTASAGVAIWIDLASRRRGLTPPGFAQPHRRWAAILLLAATFYLAVFGPLTGVGNDEPTDLSSIATPWLFALHFLMAVVLLIWYALGFLWVGPVPPRPIPPRGLPDLHPREGADAGVSPGSEPEVPPVVAVSAEEASVPTVEARIEPAPVPVPPSLSQPLAEPPPEPEDLASAPGLAAGPSRGGLLQLAEQFGLVSRRPLEDIALGLVGGIACWLGMVVVMMIVVGLTVALGGEDSLPQAAPQVVSFMVGLPWLLRLALSLSAGFFEEVFFRGFLQGRTGILLSTALFVLAHASYEQPFMLVGLTVLSLMLAYSVVWRQNVWPAIIAHATFDAVQLLVVIPLVLEMGVAPQ